MESTKDGNVNHTKTPPAEGIFIRSIDLELGKLFRTMEDRMANIETKERRQKIHNWKHRRRK